MPERFRVGLLLALALPFYLTWTFDHSLWNPDETRDAGIAAEMHRDGRVAVPTLNGEAFLEKPPLYYWTCALIYKLTGRVTAGTTRLPSALYGVLGILFTFLIGRQLFNARAGFFAAALLATTVQYFRMSHFALMDVALAALVAGSLYYYLRKMRFLFAVLVTLAFYTKGFLGVLLPGLVVTLDLLLEKRFKEWFKFVGVGAAVFAALTLPWFWSLWKEGGSKFLETFVIDNHWKRFSSSSADHTEHFWFFYLLSFPVDFLPSTLVFIGFVRALIREPHRYWDPGPNRFLVIWFFSLLTFFTLSSSKRSIYLLPLFPAAALLTGAWADEALARLPEKKAKKRQSMLLTAFGGLALAVGLSSFVFAKKLDHDKTFLPFCEAVKKNREGRLVAGFDMSEMERGVFGFYLNKPFKNITTLDDLKLFAEAPPQPFLLMVNRNRMRELEPILSGKARLLYMYRPEKKTRSYLLYESPAR